jgi:hypothetical protein
MGASHIRSSQRGKGKMAKKFHAVIEYRLPRFTITEETNPEYVEDQMYDDTPIAQEIIDYIDSHENLTLYCSGFGSVFPNPGLSTYAVCWFCIIKDELVIEAESEDEAESKAWDTASVELWQLLLKHQEPFVRELDYAVELDEDE